MLFSPLFVSPLFPLYLPPILFHFSLYISPFPVLLASNSPMRISKPAWRHLYIHPSISVFLLSPLPFPFFIRSSFFFSMWAKGKLAASFTLPKGLFKLETLQSPHSPSLLSLRTLFPFLYAFHSAGGDFHLSLQMASGVPSMPGNFVL